MFGFFKKDSKSSSENKAGEIKETSLEYKKNIVEKIFTELDSETTKNYIEINLLPGENLTITDSKFSGFPYLPKTHSVPVTSDGKQLLFLAQINCEQLPENNIYPNTGILQFWIFNEDLMGLNFDEKTSDETKRVIYYPIIEEYYNETELEEIYDPTNGESEFYTPFEDHENNKNGYVLEFVSKKEGIAYTDYRYNDMFVEKWNQYLPDEPISMIWEIKDNEIIDMIWAKYHTDVHKIGGYAFFMQEDPRGFENSEYEILLLQIASDFDKNTKKYRVIWGDCGVAGFFIKPEKLAELDFSNTLYNWDCG